MRNIIILIAIATLAFSCNSTKKAADTTVETATETVIKVEKQSIHQFKVEDITGAEFDFSTLKGKKIMVVNTASKCGLTPQYEGLQDLYEQYKDKGLMIVGFPANNFMFQEPGDNEKIKTFCDSKFGITFPMMSKISVKGKDMHPVYQFLTQAEQNGVMDSKVGWNFQKYLIDEDGFLVKFVSPKVKPMDEQIISWLEN
jgi:glutathione peroxidase